MEKNQSFFDPYNFNLQNGTVQSNQAQNNNIPNPNMLGMDMMPQIGNPNMYYEQHYMYYRYLTQVLEYKIKLREWENLNREKK